MQAVATNTTIVQFNVALLVATVLLAALTAFYVRILIAAQPTHRGCCERSTRGGALRCCMGSRAGTPRASACHRCARITWPTWAQVPAVFMSILCLIGLGGMAIAHVLGVLSRLRSMQLEQDVSHSQSVQGPSNPPINALGAEAWVAMPVLWLFGVNPTLIAIHMLALGWRHMASLHETSAYATSKVLHSMRGVLLWLLITWALATSSVPFAITAAIFIAVATIVLYAIGVSFAIVVYGWRLLSVVDMLSTHLRGLSYHAQQAVENAAAGSASDSTADPDTEERSRARSAYSTPPRAADELTGTPNASPAHRASQTSGAVHNPPAPRALFVVGASSRPALLTQQPEAEHQGGHPLGVNAEVVVAEADPSDDDNVSPARVVRDGEAADSVGLESVKPSAPVQVVTTASGMPSVEAPSFDVVTRDGGVRTNVHPPADVLSDVDVTAQAPFHVVQSRTEATETSSHRPGETSGAKHTEEQDELDEPGNDPTAVALHEAVSGAGAIRDGLGVASAGVDADGPAVNQPAIVQRHARSSSAASMPANQWAVAVVPQHAASRSFGPSARVLQRMRMEHTQKRLQSTAVMMSQQLQRLALQRRAVLFIAACVPISNVAMSVFLVLSFLTSWTEEMRALMIAFCKLSLLCLAGCIVITIVPDSSRIRRAAALDAVRMHVRRQEQRIRQRAAQLFVSGHGLPDV